jgi:hypothetical protein
VGNSSLYIHEDLLAIEVLDNKSRRASTGTSRLLAPGELQTLLLGIKAYRLANLWNQGAILFNRSTAPLCNVINQGLPNREEVEDGLCRTLLAAPIHTCFLNFHTIIIGGLWGKINLEL